MIVLSSIPHKDNMDQVTFSHLFNAAFQFKFNTGNIDPNQGDPIPAGTGKSTENLNKLLGLEFVKSEFTISGSVQRLRIDTLAFDRKNKAFVIIEYKQDKNFSVVDQGYAYLSAMLNNKADFILEYNEARKMNRSSAVAWIGLNPGLFLFPRALPLIKKKPLILKIFRLLCGR